MNDGLPKHGDAAGRVQLRCGDELEMRVIVQGAVRVNAATVVRDYGDCVLACVDLHSKRAALDCVGSSDTEGPRLYLSADEHTLHLDDSQPREASTVVEFSNLQGWRVFSADGPARYSLMVTLLAQ